MAVNVILVLLCKKSALPLTVRFLINYPPNYSRSASSASSNQMVSGEGI